MPRLTPLIAAGILFWSAGCSRDPAQNPDRRAVEARNIRDFEASWNRDYTRNDVERLVSRYTGDATVSLPNTPPAASTEAIRNLWKTAVQDGNFSMRMESAVTEVTHAGDLAWSSGTYTATMTDPATDKRVRDTGTYVFIYRKGTDTRWRVVVDCRTRSGAPVEFQ